MGMTLAYALELLPHFALASASGSSLWRGVPWRRPRCLQNLLRTGRRTGCPMLSTCVTSIEKFRTSFCESRGWVEAKGWSKNKDRLNCFPKHYRSVSEGRLCGRNQTRLHSTSSLRFTVPLHFSLPQRHTKVSAELNHSKNVVAQRVERGRKKLCPFRQCCSRKFGGGTPGCLFTRHLGGA